jgi:hypothetical protein
MQIPFIALAILFAGCTSSGELAVPDVDDSMDTSWEALDESDEVFDEFSDLEDGEREDDDDSAHADDDEDGDGVFAADDCDDTDPSVHPGATEIPDDGIDQDCTGSDTVACYLDMDGDDWGSLLAYYESDGICQPGTTTDNTDCDDDDQGINPDEEELCDIIDQDCDGDVVEGFGDSDGDNAPDCVDPPGTDSDGDTFSSEDGDCDDSDIDVFPGAVEVVDDGIDQDCNGSDSISCFLDNDGDGYGDNLAYYDADAACTAGTSAVEGDCDETDPETSDGGIELCDEIDQDCDGDFVEEWVDVDADGLPECATDPDEDGDGYTPSEGDCDDVDPFINPGEIDNCNDLDEDCDGDFVETWPDMDNDGLPECDPAVDDDGDGYAELDGDCRDGDPTINPGVAEIPDDGIDQDCNDFDSITCWEDHDTDGWGGTVGYIEPLGLPCEAPTQELGGDCDDGEYDVSPNAFEQCDALIDHDCDGDLVGGFDDVNNDGIPECPDPADNDGDGFDEANQDCDDTDPTQYPGAPEIVDDGHDQDCNGFDSVTCYFDDDQDGFGGLLMSHIDADGEGCGDDASLYPSDCDDTDHNAYIGAPEFCDEVDQDCDGDIVEGFPDADADGVPECPAIVDADGDGFGASNGDCDDTDATIYDDAPEVADDGIDQDCDGNDTVSCYLDGDDDGYGSLLAYFDGDGVCAYPTSVDGGDCDDGLADVNPDGVEVCDEIDQDCDGDILEGFPDVNADGFPDCATEDDQDADGWTVPDGDCDDADPDTFPGADEVCDDLDQDCDGDIVEGWPDANADGLPECN